MEATDDVGTQRWRRRRQVLVGTSDDFDPSSYGVEALADRAAKAFVAEHHYSGSYPASIAAFGMFRKASNQTPELVGTAVFSVPMNAGAARRYGAPGASTCDLGRFCLLDDVPGNAETWFLARAVRALGQVKTDGAGRPRHDLVLAYSDPVPRVAADGSLVMPGHVGHIYGKAGSATYLGRATPRTLVLDRSGRVLSERTLSKLRTGERGDAAAYAALIAAGAPERRPHEDAASYVRRALSEGPFTRRRHPGNHAYGIPAGTASGRRRMRAALERGLPYPEGVGKAPAQA